VFGLLSSVEPDFVVSAGNSGFGGGFWWFVISFVAGVCALVFGVSAEIRKNFKVLFICLALFFGVVFVGGFMMVLNIAVSQSSNSNVAVLVPRVKEWAVQEELVVLTDDQAEKVLEYQVDLGEDDTSSVEFVSAVDSYGDDVLVLLTYDDGVGYDLVVSSLNGEVK
jgi:hypothetical protein